MKLSPVQQQVLSELKGTGGRYIEHRPTDYTLLRWPTEGIGMRAEVVRKSTFFALQRAGVLKLKKTVNRKGGGIICEIYVAA